MSHFSTSVVLKCHTLWFVVFAQRTDQFSSQTTASSVLTQTNKQTKSNRTVTVFCDIWTVLGVFCYCFVFWLVDPFSSRWEKSSFQKGRKLVPTKGLSTTPHNFQAWKTCNSTNKKHHWCYINWISTIIKQNKSCLKGKKCPKFFNLFCFASSSFIYFFSKFALRVQKKQENTLTVMWSFL